MSHSFQKMFYMLDYERASRSSALPLLALASAIAATNDAMRTQL
jgi:hypothetical protein